MNNILKTFNHLKYGYPKYKTCETCKWHVSPNICDDPSYKEVSKKEEDWDSLCINSNKWVWKHG